MSTNVHLTAELESFARLCVENGRYNSVSEVVRDALRLLQDAERQRDQFNAMLNAVEAEADREGTHRIESVAAEMNAVIADPGK